MTDIAVDAVPKPDSANAQWKDLHTECYTPRIWAKAGISEIFFFSSHNGFWTTASVFISELAAQCIITRQKIQ